MDTLLTETISAVEWCEQVIKKQEKEVYTSLTNPRDLNHVVKSSVQSILDHLKAQGKTGMKEVENLKLKEALSILVPYLRKHESWKPSKAKPLTEEELEYAYSDLYIDKYIKVDRKFTDRQIRGQNYALFSFNPSNGAQPDTDGVYGFIKVRGAFNRIEEAEEKSKELIQYFSANQIFVCEIGSPTPLQHRLENKENVVEVDHPDRDSEENLKYADLVKDQTTKEKQQIEEIKKKVEYLKEDVTKDPNEKEPLQIYLELNQKRATGAYLYTQHLEKLEEMKTIVLRARKQIADMDEEYPDLKNEFMDHYRKTCEECGINKAEDNMAVMIKKYFGEDPDLGF
jgi:hypothetical protein